MAKITVTFEAWNEGKVAPTQHDVPIVLPKQLDFTLVDVSPGLRRELIHPDKTAFLTNIRFAPDGKRIIAGSYPGGVIVVWDVDTGKRLTRIDTGNGHANMRWLDLTPDWKTVYVARAGQRKHEKVDKDGKQLYRWEFDGSVQAWDLTTGELRRTYRHDPPRYVSGMRLSTDGNHFFTSDWLPGITEGTAKRAVTLWDARTGKHRALPDYVQYHGSFSPSGALFANTAVGKDRFVAAVKLFETDTAKEMLSIPVEEKNARVHVAEFSHDGNWLLLHHRMVELVKEKANLHDRYDVVETATGKKVASLAGETNEWLNAHFSPDARTVAASVAQGKGPKLLLFSVTENRMLKAVILNKPAKGQEAAVTDPVFSPDGKRLALITQMVPDTRQRDVDALDLPQPRIHLIDVASGEIRETLVAPQGFSREVCFSPDGRTLAVGGHGRVLLWDVKTDSR
jgi:WD40 repeat protein